MDQYHVLSAEPPGITVLVPVPLKDNHSKIGLCSGEFKWAHAAGGKQLTGVESGLVQIGRECGEAASEGCSGARVLAGHGDRAQTRVHACSLLRFSARRIRVQTGVLFLPFSPAILEPDLHLRLR